MEAALGVAGLPTVRCLQRSRLSPARCQRHQLTAAIGDARDTQMLRLGTVTQMPLSLPVLVPTPQGPSPCQERRLQRRLPSGRRAEGCPRCRSRRGPAPALAPLGSSRCIPGEEGNRGPIQRNLNALRLPACSPESCGRLRVLQWLCAQMMSELGKLRVKAARLTAQS